MFGPDKNYNIEVRKIFKVMGASDKDVKNCFALLFVNLFDKLREFGFPSRH